MAEKIDPEMARFQSDLMASVREMNIGQAARETRVELSPVARARARTGLTQKGFAALIGVSEGTVQQWEQGRREPSGAARVLIRVADCHPEVLRKMMA